MLTREERKIKSGSGTQQTRSNKMHRLPVPASHERKPQLAG